jgi:hypothetical protein
MAQTALVTWADSYSEQMALVQSTEVMTSEYSRNRVKNSEYNHN